MSKHQPEAPAVPGVTREPWYNDEDIDYQIKAENWPAGGGPLEAWPEHLRLAVVCSEHGRTQSHPGTADLLDLVTEVKAHHHEKHGGPDWRHQKPAGEPLVLPPDEPAATGAAARVFGAVVTKPCGCGPDEPCGAHAEAGPSDNTAHALTAAPDGMQERTGAVPADGRESLGRIVRETWVAWACEQYRPKPSWLLPWEEIDNGQREVDMRIGHAVANYALTENAATWGTSCTSCAAYLDRASAERERAERAEAKLAKIEAVCREPGTATGFVPPSAILAIIGTEEESHRG